MTITPRGTGTAAVNTLSPAPSFPAGVVATDISFLTVSAKANSGVLPNNVTCATPAGWTLLFAGSSGNSAPGTPELGTGSVNIWIFTKTGNADTGSVALTLTNHSNATAVINTYAGTLGGWNTATVYGYDNNSAGTGYDSNATVTSANLNITTGDWMLVHSATTNSAALGTVTLTATGATLASSTGTSRYSALSTITSPDTSYVRMDVRDVTVSSGTSTAGPRMQAAGVMDGISVFVLLREGIRAVSGAETVSSLDRSSLGSTDVLPTIKTWVSGDALDAATLNAYLRDPIAWLLTESPGIQLQATAAVTFTTTTHTITWDTIPRYRRGSIVVNGTKISVPVTGHYVGEVSIGIKDLDAMLNGWLLTIDLLMYPGGTGAATVQNNSMTFTDMNTEGSFAIGSVPFEFYLNQGDAIEVRLSGAWGTTADTALLVDLTSFSVLNMIDLHWEGFWEGGTV